MDRDGRLHPLTRVEVARPTVLLVAGPPALERYATALRRRFRVFVARDGMRGLALAEQLAWGADVLVVDLSSSRGAYFVNRFQQRAGHRVPVIAVSAEPSRYQEELAVRPQAVLMQPVDTDDLVREVGFFARLRRRPETER